MRIEWEKTDTYRARTATMSAPVSDTFWCSVCKKGRGIAGRKKVVQDGRRVSYACKACQEGK